MLCIVGIGLCALLAGCSCNGRDDGGGGKDAPPETSPSGRSDLRVDDAADLPEDPASDQVRLCVTDDGAVVLAWVDDRDGTRAVWARRSPDGGISWPDPPVRFGGDGAVAEHPDLVCDGSSAILAWEDYRDGERINPNVYLAVSPDGGATWRPEQGVTGDELGAWSHLAPRLAAANGRVHVTWYGDELGAYDVFTNSSSDGGETFADVPPRLDADPPGSAWSAHPVVATDGSGDAVVVAWEDRRSGVVDLYVAASETGGLAFDERRLDDSDEADSYAPALHVGSGFVHAAWHDRRDGEAYEVYVARSTDGGSSFEEPIRVSAGEPAGTVDAVLPQLGWSEGALQVTWYGAAGGGYHVMHRLVRDGVPSGEPVRLDHAPGAAKARYPRLAVSGADVVVAWQDDRAATAEGEADLFFAYSGDGGETFAEEWRLDASPPGGPAPTDLALAVSQGALLAAWSDARSGNPDVWFARLELGEIATVR